jgi:kynureninase
MNYQNSLAFAKSLDRADPLRRWRNSFLIPPVKNKPAIYFTGNSLGLQPKSAKRFIEKELGDWAKLGVEGHFQAHHPWLRYHEFSQRSLAKLTGAKQGEVIAMNQLTVNLHLMLTSFYRPKGTRYKILMEGGAFSSDQYAIESQVKWHGYRPDDAIVELTPRPSEYTLRTEDIVDAVDRHKDSLALVLFGAVQYYSGQFFDLARITEASHRAGALAGFDLAHAIGNVPLHLHRDRVDFAVWCGYKYLNSGPGGIAGAFVHESHADNPDIPRLAGWWGHEENDRFEMKKGFKPMTGVAGWQVSNFPVFSGAVQLAALGIFDRVGMSALRRKSILLTGFLEFLLAGIEGKAFRIITPEHYRERGCQLSILVEKKGRRIFQALTRQGVIADWREPDVIRVAPVPLYNTFEEVYRFATIFQNAVRT